MNPLTLDFIRRWKWLLLILFGATAAAWVFHARPQARLHLEVLVAVAMSWDLMRGVVRGQLALPQRRESIAAGLWFSVVGVGAVTQIAAMLLGGALLAPLLGQAVNPGALSLHFVISLILIGAVQFILTGLPSSPPRTLAGQVKGTLFAGLWGLPMFGSFWIAFFAPADWREVTAVHGGIMVLLGIMAVASWFTTRSMMMERAMPNQNASPSKSSGGRPAMSRDITGWRVWLIQEGRWFLPVVFMTVLAAVFMISIRPTITPAGAPQAVSVGDFYYRSIGMLCVMTVFPLLAVSVGTLRACRGLPFRLWQWAVVVALRPFAAGLMVTGFFTVMVGALTHPLAWDLKMLWAYLPLCSAMSLVQAVMLRYPRLPVVFGLLMMISALGSLFPEMLRHANPGSPAMAAAATAVVLLSLALHVRWLGRSGQIYRLSSGFMKIFSGLSR